MSSEDRREGGQQDPRERRQQDRSDPTDRTDLPLNLPQQGFAGARPRLRSGGGYRQLKSFQITTIIYDGTVFFCERFIDSHSRLIDQMVMAARSGRQNIAEGSRAGTGSSQTEIRLVNVARASLDELLLDYEDFLRQKRHKMWDKFDAAASELRRIRFTEADFPPFDPQRPDDRRDQFGPYVPWLTSGKREVVANALICLIHQANYLLDQQISALEQSFIQGGGYSEQLAAARLEFRRGEGHKQDQSDRSDRTDLRAKAPACPKCSQPMLLRRVRQGERSGEQFWGCCQWPSCDGRRRM